jgi:hypothetical protein
VLTGKINRFVQLEGIGRFYSAYLNPVLIVLRKGQVGPSLPKY